MLERIGHHRGNALGVLQTHELHVTVHSPLEAACELGHSRRGRIRERHEQVDIGAVARSARGVRAEEHGHAHARLRTKRVAKFT